MEGLFAEYEAVSEVERKTATASSANAATLTVTASRYREEKTDTNILNDYRLYTYNFVLAGLPKEYANEPSKYKGKELDLVVIKSGGKGDLQLNNNYGAVVKRSATNRESFDPNTGAGEFGQSSVDDTALAQSLIDDFNKYSPGRFDMYIDNVQLTTAMAFNEKSNTTFVTGLSFDVFEPLSISGFIEALHVTAVSAGYLSYLGATFLFKIGFVGYKDNTKFPEPEIIKKAERYIPIQFKNVEVEVTENGTKYKCTAVPFTDMAFGDLLNKLRKPIKMEGTTVQEVLEALMRERTAQEAKTNKDFKPNEVATKGDEFYIKFPSRNSDGSLDYNTPNKIAGEKLSLLTRRRVYAMPDPGDAKNKNQYQADDQKNSPDVPYEPNKVVVQFADKQNVSDCISSVIRDSEYVRNMLKNLGKEKTIDQNGMIDYWVVVPEIENFEIDPVAKKPRQKITYNVIPHKVHVTNIPGYSGQKFNFSRYRPLLLREYNYLYTGKNVDVRNFKLDFNSMFIEVVPRALGNSEYLSARDSFGKNSETKPEFKPEDLEAMKRGGLPVAPLTSSIKGNDVVATGGNAGPNPTDPYGIMARNLHESILNIQGSLIQGELEIIGDPIFITSTGMGNFKPSSTRPGLTEEGEVDRTYGQALINLTFRNPIDINPLKDGGRAVFRNKASFSGVYFVKQVVSTFKEGQFNQKLSIARMLGQTLDDDEEETNVAEKMVTRPNPLDQPIQDQSQALKPSQRASNANLFSSIGSIVSGIAGIGTAASSAFAQLSANVTSGLTAATQPIADITNKITNTIRQVTNPVADAAAKLGLTPDQLSQLTPAQILTLQAAAALIPNNVSPNELKQQGVVVNMNKISNYPPVQPKVQAPISQANAIDVATILQSSGNLTNAYPSGAPSDAQAVAGALASSTKLTNPAESLNTPSLITAPVTLKTISVLDEKYTTDPESPFARLQNLT